MLTALKTVPSGNERGCLFWIGYSYVCGLLTLLKSAFPERFQREYGPQAKQLKLVENTSKYGIGVFCLKLMNERHFTNYTDLNVVFALICFSILIKKDWANIKLQLFERKTK